MSVRQETRNRAYNRRVKAWKKEHPHCQVCLDLRKVAKFPRIRATNDCHHVRGRVGKLLMDERYWLPVCRKHHDEIHRFPAWAKVNGYIAAWGKHE